MGQSNYVHLDGAVVKRVTDKAALINFLGDDGDDREEWFPLSQIADGDELEEDGEVRTISVTEWIAKQKDIEV